MATVTYTFAKIATKKGQVTIKMKHIASKRDGLSSTKGEKRWTCAKGFVPAPKPTSTFKWANEVQLSLEFSFGEGSTGVKAKPENAGIGFGLIVRMRNFLALAKKRTAKSLAAIESGMGFKSTGSIVCMAEPCSQPADQPAAIARQSTSHGKQENMFRLIASEASERLVEPFANGSDFKEVTAKRGQLCADYMHTHNLTEAGRMIQEGMGLLERKDFLLDSASTVFSVWLMSRTLKNAPAPKFEEGNTYLVGFPLLVGDKAQYKCVIGDIEILMADVRKDEHKLKNLTDKNAKQLFAEQLFNLGKECLSLGLWLNADELANMAAAVTINTLATKPTTKAVLAAHLVEVLVAMGVNVDRIHAVNSAWNLPRYGADRAFIRKIMQGAIRAQNLIGMTSFRYIDLREGDEQDEVFLCGERFVVNNEGVIYDDNGTHKRLNRVMLAAPIKVGRYLSPNEFSIMSAHDVLLYVIDSVVFPLINRKDSSTNKGLDLTLVEMSYARVAQSVRSFLSTYVPLNERAVALGKEDAASSILTSTELSCVIKWHESQFYRSTKNGKTTLLKRGMLVGGGDSNADKTQEEIFRTAALKSEGNFADYHPLIKPLIEAGQVVQPFGSKSAVSINVHGIAYDQLPVEKQVDAVKAFWTAQGETEVSLREKFNLGGVIGDIWMHIASETFEFLSYKGAKRLKRSANLYAQVTTFAGEEVSRFSWADSPTHAITGLPLKAVLAPSLVFPGPGMSYMNSYMRDKYEMRYPLAGSVKDYYDNSSVWSPSDEEVKTDTLSGWSHIDIATPVVENGATGFVVRSEGGLETQLRAEHTGVLCKVSWRVVDKFSVANVLEVRLFYKVSEFDFKLRGGYKAMTTYHDGSIFDHSSFAPEWDIIVPGDSNKTLDLLTCFIPEAAESFGRAPLGTMVDGVDVHELLRELNAEAMARNGIEGEAPNDRLIVDRLMLNEKKYEQLRQLFISEFATVMWLSVESSEMKAFIEEFYTANCEGGGDWRTLTQEEMESLASQGVPADSWAVCDTAEITDETNILLTYEEFGYCQVLHRQMVYASTPTLPLYMIGKPEYTTVSQAVSQSSLMSNSMYDMALRSPEVAQDLMEEGQINRERYSLIQRLSKGLPIAIDEVEVPHVMVQGEIGKYLGDHAAAVEQAFLEGPNQFFTALLKAFQEKVLRFEADNGGWVSIYLPLLASYGGQDLESNQGMTLASKVYELMSSWYAGASSESSTVKVTAGEVKKMMTKLVEGGRMQKSLTYGSKGVGFKVGAMPNIPTGEIWVHKEGEVYATMRKLFGKNFRTFAAEGKAYVGVMRAPMTRMAILKVRVIDKKVNKLLPYKINGVQGYVSVFSQYFNMGDFDGDGVLSVNVTKHVHSGALTVDSYDSMLAFQRETLGYDMMSPLFWGSEAPAQYYADHFYVQSHASVMSKIGGRGVNLKSAEKSNTVTRAQLIAEQHNALAQQGLYVSDSYQTQFFNTVAAEILTYHKVGHFDWLRNCTYQTQALYEVALGGYSSDMAQVAFGLMSRTFRLATNVDWWLQESNAELSSSMSQEVKASTLFDYEPVEKEGVLFTCVPSAKVFPAMQRTGFGWAGFSDNKRQMHEFVIAGALAGVAKKRVSEVTNEEAGIGSATIDALTAKYGFNMELTMKLAQRLMDVSRNKCKLGTKSDNVLREELTSMLKGFKSDSMSVELFHRIEKALNDSVSEEVVSYDSRWINALCRFVEPDQEPVLTVEEEDTASKPVITDDMLLSTSGKKLHGIVLQARVNKLLREGYVLAASI